MDEDNADVYDRQSLDLVIEASGLRLFAEKSVLGDLQPSPSLTFSRRTITLGYRLAQTAQDLLGDWEELRRARRRLRGKGFKGAVGTSASYADLLGEDRLPEFETLLSTRLGLPFYRVTTQTYPRKQDYQVVSALAGLGATLYKFAFDLRLLQSPPVGEQSEPFGRQQVGSSAMPFKRNPIQAEKIDSLARQPLLPRLAWDNAAHSLLERTLDDSANRRTLLPEAFLISDELLGVSLRIVSGLQISKTAMRRNLAIYSPLLLPARLDGAGQSRRRPAGDACPLARTRSGCLGSRTGREDNPLAGSPGSRSSFAVSS
jgi:adenylosuccinate lyase